MDPFRRYHSYPRRRSVLLSFYLVGVVSSAIPSRRRSAPRFAVLSVVILPPCAVSACSSLGVLSRRSVPVSFLGPSSVGSSRSPFLDTHGGAFFSFDSERASKHEGVAGRGIAMGVASMRWAGADKQAGRKGRRSDMKSPRLIYETERGGGVSCFHARGGEAFLFLVPRCFGYRFS